MYKEFRNARRKSQFPYLFLFKKCGLFVRFKQYSQCIYQCLKANGSSTITQFN